MPPSAIETPLPRLGFIGTGTIASAMVEGFCTLPPAMLSPITVSKRNEARSFELCSKFPGLVSRVDTNQEVVSRSDVVFLCVLPEIASSVLEELTWSTNQIVVNVVASVNVREMIADQDVDVVRAVPLPPVADHKGATLISPPHATVKKLFDLLGTATEVENEEQLFALQAVTSLMGPFYRQLQAVTEWLKVKGVSEKQASPYVGAMFAAIAHDAKEAPAKQRTFRDLVEEQTPGGLNEGAIHRLENAGVYHAIQQAMEQSLTKLSGRSRS